MAIEIKNLFYAYTKGNYVLNDVNLTLEEGSFTALIGETGSGKSTLVQNLNALLIPTSGEIHVDEFVVTNNKRKNKKDSSIKKKSCSCFPISRISII